MNVGSCSSSTGSFTEPWRFFAIAPGEAIAEGEPWTFRVPTSLVVLEEGLNLPLSDFSDQLQGDG